MNTFPNGNAAGVPINWGTPQYEYLNRIFNDNIDYGDTKDGRTQTQFTSAEAQWQAASNELGKLGWECFSVTRFGLSVSGYYRRLTPTWYTTFTSQAAGVASEPPIYPLPGTITLPTTFRVGEVVPTGIVPVGSGG